MLGLLTRVIESLKRKGGAARGKNKQRTGKNIYASLGFNGLLTFDHTENTKIQTPKNPYRYPGSAESVCSGNCCTNYAPLIAKVFSLFLLPDELLNATKGGKVPPPCVFQLLTVFFFISQPSRNNVVMGHFKKYSPSNKSPI